MAYIRHQRIGHKHVRVQERFQLIKLPRVDRDFVGLDDDGFVGDRYGVGGLIVGAVGDIVFGTVSASARDLGIVFYDSNELDFSRKVVLRDLSEVRLISQYNSVTVNYVAPESSM